MNYPRGHPDIEANVWRLLLSSTCCLPAWLGASGVLPGSCSDHQNDSFFHSIPSCLYLSFFYHPFAFASPPPPFSLSISVCPKHFLWLSLHPCPHLHMLLLSLWLSVPIVFPTHPFSTTFLPTYSPSLHLRPRLLFYSDGWGVGLSLPKWVSVPSVYDLKGRS